MPAKYLIRLDDACSTCNLSKWTAIEKILDDFGVAPIVAVVPDNKDPNLVNDDENPDFWLMVKHWQEKGWYIAMHGYQHVYHEVSRKKLVLPFYDRSEFGGLSLEEQKIKIRNSMEIFRQNGIKPRLWVAPGHSFDKTTLKALATEVPFRIVSDGIAFSSYSYEGFYFVPQQLWRVKKRYFGFWTICLHPDTMTEQSIESFRSDLSQSFVKDSLVSLGAVELTSKNKDLPGKLFSLFFWLRYRLAALIKTR
jgi:predicted deacetylase